MQPTPTCTCPECIDPTCHCGLSLSQHRFEEHDFVAIGYPCLNAPDEPEDAITDAPAHGCEVGDLPF